MIELRGMNPEKAGELFIELYGNDEELQEQLKVVDYAMRSIMYTRNTYSAHVGKIQLIYLSQGRYEEAREAFLASDRNSAGHLVDLKKQPDASWEARFSIPFVHELVGQWPLNKEQTSVLQEEHFTVRDEHGNAIEWKLTEQGQDGFVFKVKSGISAWDDWRILLDYEKSSYQIRTPASYMRGVTLTVIV